MIIRNLIGVCFLILAVVVLTSAFAGVQSGASKPTGMTQTFVIIKPSSSVIAMAKNPTPPPNAQQQSSIGSGETSLQTSDKPQDMDSYWSESIDIDGDGKMDETNLLWDDEDKVLYLSKQGPFMCRSGGQGDGDILMAIYGKGNSSKRPAGSGWFVAQLDANECDAPAQGLVGCRFDANGKATECGTARLDDNTDDVIITHTKISER